MLINEKNIDTSKMTKFFSESEKKWDKCDVKMKRVEYGIIDIRCRIHMKKIVEILPPDIDFQKLVIEKLTNMESDIKDLKNMESDIKDLKNMESDIKDLKHDVNNLKDDMNIVKTEIKVINTRLDRVEQDIKEIKECPTIKKELKEMKK